MQKSPILAIFSSFHPNLENMSDIEILKKGRLRPKISKMGTFCCVLWGGYFFLGSHPPQFLCFFLLLEKEMLTGPPPLPPQSDYGLDCIFLIFFGQIWVHTVHVIAKNTRKSIMCALNHRPAHKKAHSLPIGLGCYLYWIKSHKEQPPNLATVEYFYAPRSNAGIFGTWGYEAIKKARNVLGT